MEKKNGDSLLEKNQVYRKDNLETTVIRISNKNYESLRKKDFYNRTTIRKIADEILEEELSEGK